MEIQIPKIRKEYKAMLTVALACFFVTLLGFWLAGVDLTVRGAGLGTAYAMSIVAGMAGAGFTAITFWG